MVACAVVSLLGLLITYCFVEDRRGKGMEGEPAEGALPADADAAVAEGGDLGGAAAVLSIKSIGASHPPISGP